MKTFTRLNILIIVLALAASSCQKEEGFLSELSTTGTKYQKMEFTLQVPDLDGFQILQEESDASNLDKILRRNSITENQLNAIYLKEANFLPYFKEQKMIMTARGFLEERIYEKIRILAMFKFVVKASI